MVTIGPGEKAPLLSADLDGSAITVTVSLHEGLFLCSEMFPLFEF